MTNYIGDASWVWVEKQRGAANDYVAFRLVVPGLEALPEKSCRISVSASNIYLLHVNGVYLGRGPVRSWGGHIGVDRYDIKRYLKKGANVISALVHYHGAVEAPDDADGFSRSGFILRGNIGHIPLSTGNAGWECFRPACWNRKSARISGNFGYNEDVNMAAYCPGKWRQGAAGREWRKAAVITDRGLHRPFVVRRSIPYLDEKIVGAPALTAIGVCKRNIHRHDCASQFAAIMADEKHLPIKAGAFQISGKPWPVRLSSGIVPYLIVDAGRFVSGVIELDITAPSDLEVRIGYDQIVYADQRPVIESEHCFSDDPADNTELALKADHGGAQNAVDRLFLKKGQNHWTGMFNVRGFRYVKIRFSRLTEPLVVNMVRIREITHPVRNKAKFKCNDALLNQIWEAARLTTRLGMFDTFIDNPSRERMQYGNQGYQQALYAHYFFGETRLWRQFLRMFPQGMRADGAIQSGGPWPWNQIIPAYQFFWMESIHEYVLRTGKADVCRELAGKVADALRWYVRFENKAGLLVIPEIFDRSKTSSYNVLWNFFDWQEDGGQLKGAGADVALNCLYARALTTAAWILSRAGRDEECKALVGKSKKLRAVLSYAFKRKKPGTCVEHAIVHATLAGIIRGRMKQVAADAMAGKLKSDVEHMFLTLQALMKEGHKKAVLSIVREKFGRMIKDGSSTIYESIDARRNTSRSLCQGSGGSAGYFLPEIVGFIDGK